MKQLTIIMTHNILEHWAHNTMIMIYLAIENRFPLELYSCKCKATKEERFPVAILPG